MVVENETGLLYAITQLSALFSPRGTAAAAAARNVRWRTDLERWADEGVDVVQLREKDLDAGEVYALAAAGVRLLAGRARRPRLLVNGRPDLAAAAGADGVHLTSAAGELQPGQVRAFFRAARRPLPLISRSAHTVEEARQASRQGIDLLLFGPVREKRIGDAAVQRGSGVELLAEACAAAAPVPVLALGGVRKEDACGCRQAGAAGLAGIRLFA